MRVLMLEDDVDERGPYLLALYTAYGHDVTWVTTVPEAQEAWGDRHYDLISLDHDLGQREDGMSFLRWALMQPDVCEAPRQWIVHSLNVVRAPVMVDLLHQAGCCVHRVLPKDLGRWLGQQEQKP